MIRNPLINALAAALYIALVAFGMYYGSRLKQGDDDTVLAPIAMISLLTLSVAMMGYLFLAQPLQLYLDGKKKEAVDFFLKTLGVFAGITVFFLLALLAL